MASSMRDVNMKHKPFPQCPICKGTGDKNQDDIQVVWAPCPCTIDPLYFTKKAIEEASTIQELEAISNALRKNP